MDKSHEIVLEVINKIGNERMNLREKYNRKLRKLDVKPLFLCYRTAELLPILLDEPLIKENEEARNLIYDFFHTCTRNVFYYIHLDDFKNIIRNHGKYNEWSVDLKY